MHQTPFGETTLDTEAVRMPMRFPGQYADIESGYSYNYFRDYDPTLGRYVESDPIGLGGGANTFGYALLDPMYKPDFFGQDVFVQSRHLNIAGVGEAGAHTSIVIEISGSTFTYASYNENGKNVVEFDPPSDSGPSGLPMSDRVEIPPPKGITQDQWDSLVLKSAEHIMQSPVQRYEAFPRQYEAEGNCHTTTRRIIEGAGGEIPSTFDPSGFNPDLHPEPGR